MPDSLTNISSEVKSETNLSVGAKALQKGVKKSTAAKQSVSDSVALPDSSVLNMAGHQIDTVVSTTRTAYKLPCPAYGHSGTPLQTTLGTSSWVLTLLLLIFVAVCFRFKKNRHYIKTLVSDLTDIRSRGNMFDNTMRETSFVIVLNIMCIASESLMLHTLLSAVGAISSAMPFHLTAVVVIGAVFVFHLYQAGMYLLTGNIFADSFSTKVWIKGFLSSQSILSVILFPLSLLTIFQPQWVDVLLILGGIAFVLARCVFIFKGIRIFFAQSLSWLLFLYYLCSLEVIPIILTYIAAYNLCLFLI